MKFGETIGQRSVPKWAAYNLNYNDLKHLIKIRTTNSASAPVPIPGQSNHRWSLLEDELFDILKAQHDNIALFLRSKNGEIERRLAYLEKSVRSAKRAAKLYTARPSLQARKYQKLLNEAENIGEDIQALSRFAAVQRTAFRKILKKYRKWTNSDALQLRLEQDVFSTGQLDLNLSDSMQRLSAQISIVKDLEADLQAQSAGEHGQTPARTSKNLESPVAQITKASQSSPLAFDAAFAFVPFGEASGTATYWIHPDNFDEARVLLLRYARDMNVCVSLTRDDSTSSLSSAATGVSTPRHDDTVHACYLDNAHRFLQDNSISSPSMVAMCARWSQSKEAVVSMSDMSSRSDNYTTVKIKRKDLGIAIDRSAPALKDRSANAANIYVVKDFLSQHRDVKALATSRSSRSRYAGTTNSSEVGLWATLDSNIVFSSFSTDDIHDYRQDKESDETFPHAVLQIRWEFGRKPEVVRAFDTTHLAEKVQDFSLESAAIHDQQKDLAKPLWVQLISKDIRKVPVSSRVTRSRNEIQTGTFSGPSSNDGPTDSVFSAPLVVASSAGSETSPMASTRDLSETATIKKEPRHSKKARIAAESPRRDAPRYYSEYDDPDSEFNQQDAYAIYCDPNEEAWGMATMHKIGSAFGNMASWFMPEKHTSKRLKKPSERTGLLQSNSATDEENQSSESESDQADPTAVPQHKGLQGHVRPAERYRIRLSRRQRAFERTLAQFYCGLIVLSYIFLMMSGILLTTGRRKEVIEVDVGATVGVVVAFACMIISIVLVYMRKEKLRNVEKISLSLADGLIVLFGVIAVIGIVRRAQHIKK